MKKPLLQAGMTPTRAIYPRVRLIPRTVERRKARRPLKIPRQEKRREVSSASVMPMLLSGGAEGFLQIARLMVAAAVVTLHVALD